jgi:SulP family sulfate permease
VTVGFTAGIALVIAVLQMSDLLGLSTPAMPEAFIGKVGVIATSLSSVAWPDVLVSAVTFGVMWAWPSKKLSIPGYAPAILVGGLVAGLLAASGHPVATIGSRFTYELSGEVLHGVPRMIPHFVLPWQLQGANASGFSLSLATLRALLPAAFSIAMLGAIESLLCAVVLDRSSSTRHHSNGELLGQGLANVVAPFFGGVPSTAAIARSAANLNAGARTPLAAAFHSLFVLAGILLLAPSLAYVPMASMAAVLVSVAWNMSEAPTVVQARIRRVLLPHRGIRHGDRHRSGSGLRILPVHA